MKAYTIITGKTVVMALTDALIMMTASGRTVVRKTTNGTGCMTPMTTLRTWQMIVPLNRPLGWALQSIMLRTRLRSLLTMRATSITAKARLTDLNRSGCSMP